MGSPLQEKSKAFALQIIKVCNEVKVKKRESVLTNQLIRSGTSIGANVREAFYAHGRAVLLQSFKSPSKNVPKANIGWNY